MKGSIIMTGKIVPITLLTGYLGAGKTTLMNYISNLVGNQRKLFLTKTHSANQNLQRRIAWYFCRIETMHYMLKNCLMRLGILPL